ncbi:MAG: HAMP domain-containing protein, partial [Vicinamibacterales bacterium]
MHHRAGTPSLSWHRRLEARVTAAVSAIVAASLGALLLLTTDAVSSQSYTRASTELQIAQTALDHQLLTRASAATRSLQLVTELPVLRAHLLDSRLAGDRDTVTAMAEDYRVQLGATFLVVTDARGIWLSQPGWQDGTEDAAPLERLVAEAREGSTPAAIVSVGSRLFLALSAPARFSEEVLGTLTAGFSIDDGLAAELARLAHSEAIVWSGDRVMATSLTREPGVEVLRAAREALAASPDRPHPLIQLGGRQFVAASFPLQPPGLRSVPGRLVVLADWQPTAAFIDGLNARFLLAGLAVFGIALAGGLALSRSISRPLRQIASAAARIAEGDLTLRLPDEGSAEAVTVAHAFNDMSEALREARERLVHDAIHEPLTQLPNRVLLMERLDRAIARRVRHPDYRFGVLFIDVDR